MTDLFDWTPPPKYPETPGWKEPTTSREAAKKAERKAPADRMAALAVIKASPNGLTAHEVAARMGRSIMAISPRISELRKLGLVVPAMDGAKPRRRPNESGCSATVLVCR